MSHHPAAVLDELSSRLQNGVALRRATRVAVVVPIVMVALTNIPPLSGSALFGVFAALALLLFADFGGPLRDRFIAYLVTTAVGAVFLVVGITLGQSIEGAAAVMFVVALAVGMFGVLRGPVASAQTVLLLATVLAVTSAPAGTQAAALACWLVGGLAAAVSALVLWPAHPSRKLARALGGAYTAAAAAVRSRWVAPDRDAHATALQTLDEELKNLHTQYDGNLLRPSGLTNRDRALAQAVDLVGRLRAYQRWPDTPSPALPGDDEYHAINARLATEIAAELDEVAAALHADAHSTMTSDRIRMVRDHHLDELIRWVARERQGDAPPAAIRDRLDDAFPLRLSSVSTELAAASANPRARFDDPLLVDEVEAAQQGIRTRLARNASWESPWFRNALRTAIALAASVALAKTLGLEHGFWIVLGTLTALRFDALGTGRTALQALLGTAIGVTIGAALIVAIGDRPAVWWALVPIVLLVAAYTPGNFSLTTGQAGFSVTVIVLFSVLFPASLTTAELRLLDVAIGLSVSLLISALMWPHGVAATLKQRMSDAFLAAGDHLLLAIDFVAGGAVDQRMLKHFADRSAVALDRAREAYDLSVAQRPPENVPVQRWFRVALVARHVDAAANLLPGVAGLVSARGGGRTIPSELIAPVLDTSHDVRDDLRRVLAAWQECDLSQSFSEGTPERLMAIDEAPGGTAVRELRDAIDAWMLQPSDWEGTTPDPRPAMLAWIADWNAFVTWNALQLEATLRSPASLATA